MKTIRMRCKVCAFVDLIFIENAIAWECPNCEFEKKDNEMGQYYAKHIRIVENPEIVPPKLTKGMAIKAGKFAAKIKRISGLSEELLGKSE